MRVRLRESETRRGINQTLKNQTSKNQTLKNQSVNNRGERERVKPVGESEIVRERERE